MGQDSQMLIVDFKVQSGLIAVLEGQSYQLTSFSGFQGAKRLIAVLEGQSYQLTSFGHASSQALCTKAATGSRSFCCLNPACVLQTYSKTEPLCLCCAAALDALESWSARTGTAALCAAAAAPLQLCLIHLTGLHSF
jgi:hypothetical protein